MEEKSYKLYRNVFYIMLGLFIIGVLVWIVYIIHPFEVSLTAKTCLFYAIFHIYCPGCGGTHALTEFMDFHFFKSFMNNPLVVIIAYLFTRYIIEGTITFLIKRDDKSHFVMKFRDMYICLGIYLAFIIIRDVLLVLGIYDYGGNLINYWM